MVSKHDTPDLTVYSAVFGEYDIQMHQRVKPTGDPKTRWVVYTDGKRLHAPHWEKVLLNEIHPGHRYQNRCLKIKSWEAVDTEKSVYLDGYLAVDKPRGLFRPDVDLCLASHPDRNNAYAECEHLVKVRKIDRAKGNKLLKRYGGRLGKMALAGLYSGGLIIRKHTQAVRDFEECWWKHYDWCHDNGIGYDQISLAMAVQETKIRVHVYPPRIYKRRPHRA